MNRAAKMTFVGSIILNVLLLGFVVGQSPRRFDRGAMRQQRMEQVIKDLPNKSFANRKCPLIPVGTVEDSFFAQTKIGGKVDGILKGDKLAHNSCILK